MKLIETTLKLLNAYVTIITKHTQNILIEFLILRNSLSVNCPVSITLFEDP